MILSSDGLLSRLGSGFREAPFGKSSFFFHVSVLFRPLAFADRSWLQAMSIPGEQATLEERNLLSVGFKQLVT
eukprot:4863255-Amphidinium_carterae.1